MYVIVCVLLADGVHGRSKFTSAIGFGGGLDVGQQCERELWDSNDDSVCGHSGAFDCISSMLTLTFFDHLKQLLQHVIRGRSVGPVNRYLHHLVERVVINAFEVASICRL